jgi:hypothetical protein
MRTNAKHTRRARELFGSDAIAYSERSRKFSDDSRYKNLAGKCSTCLRRECEAKTTYVIGVDIGIAMSLRGRGHTWDAAWAEAEKSDRRVDRGSP